MKYIKRFIKDLLYGYPAFSNLWWGIKEDRRERNGYYKMDKIPLGNLEKWCEILIHKRRIIEKKDSNKIWKAINNYNEVIDKI